MEGIAPPSQGWIFPFNILFFLVFLQGYVNQAVVAQDYEDVAERSRTNTGARAYENIL